MKKQTGFFKNLIAFALSIIILLLSFSTLVFSEMEKDIMPGTFNLSSYEDYTQSFGSTAIIKDSVLLNADNLNDYSENVLIYEEYEGKESSVIEMPEGSWIEWTFEAGEEFVSNILFEYYPVTGRGSSIEREIYINGEIPFYSASKLAFERNYTDSREIYQDNRGNDIRPSQIESAKWIEKYAQDYLGYYPKPFLFKFNKGTNTLRILATREAIAFGQIYLTQTKDFLTYKNAFEEYRIKTIPELEDGYILIEGEKASYKTDPTLYPTSDRSSPATSPYKGSKISLNTIGGYNWRFPGQKITWEFNAPQSGLYSLAIKSRQHFINGGIVSRKLYINGQIPFAEMNNIVFDYSNKWYNKILKDNEEIPYRFNFEKGINTISLEVSLGEIAPLIRMAEESLFSLNTIYRKILMITGSSPDIYADYKLERILPDEINLLKEESKNLYYISEEFERISGESGSNTAILRRIAYQLDDFNKRPETIPERFSTFKDNITGLSAWVLSASEQPLEIDYLMIFGEEIDAPPADVGFINKVIHEMKMFVFSFTEDYNSIGNTTEDAIDVIDVWISTGRDQAQTIKSLIDETFTPKENISVNLRLVQQGALLSAVVAGIGPDVALQMPDNEPLNYAIRGAVVDLKGFSDFPEVVERFHKEAMTAYSFNNGVFALPETTTFPMLFYRMDILEELGLEVPETWDELYEMLPVLQKNNMNFFLPVSLPTLPYVGVSTYYTLLYQNGGEMYSEDRTHTLIGNNSGIDAFRKWVELYYNYKLPIVADFPNRFRIGEVPIGIQDYSMFNMLTVFAPEIKGLWSFAPVPGIRRKDGTINRTVAAGGISCMLMNNEEKKEYSWEFMKWWTSSDIQVQYGREMESIMGAAARYPTANLEAFEQLPWSFRDYQNLSIQRQSIKGIPQILGSYFMPRHLDNAFRSVVFSGTDPRETLNDYIKTINEEITAKRNEFGLETR